MGKRSNFDRKDKDFYETPISAVIPLMKHLPDHLGFIDPCCGNGNIGKHIADLKCVNPSWIDWWEFDLHDYGGTHSIADATIYNYPDDTGSIFITNPPWQTKAKDEHGKLLPKDKQPLHMIIDNLSGQAPTWLLFSADWMHTKQASEYMKYCVKVVSVGRVKWFADTKNTGMDNACWYLFDKNFTGQTEFYGR